MVEDDVAVGSNEAPRIGKKRGESRKRAAVKSVAQVRKEMRQVLGEVKSHPSFAELPFELRRKINALAGRTVKANRLDPAEAEFRSRQHVLSV